MYIALKSGVSLPDFAASSMMASFVSGGSLYFVFRTARLSETTAAASASFTVGSATARSISSRVSVPFLSASHLANDSFTRFGKVCARVSGERRNGNEQGNECE